MPSYDCHALVLKTYDVGEADRFAILLTDRFGRIAVRARGVRKTQSRLMGTIQSLQLLKVHFDVRRDRWTLTGAQLIESFRDLRENLPAYHMACQGIELLLKILEDDEPVREVFEAAREYLFACSSPPPLLFEAFAVQIFALLGLHDRTSSRDWISRVRTFSSQEQRQLKRECTKLLEQHNYILVSSTSVPLTPPLGPELEAEGSVPSVPSRSTPTCSQSGRGS